MTRTQALLWLLVATTACALRASSATRDHIVGGSFGWRIPQNTTFYQEWAQNRTFVVGDRLVFLFRTGVHSLIEVPKEDFDRCTQTKPIDMWHNGPLILELTKPGPHYYYCGIGIHCEAGEKLSIDVLATAPVVVPAAGPPADAAASSAGSLRRGLLLAGALVYLLQLAVM